MNDETRNRKRNALNQADATGVIADSLEVRGDIMRRIHAGEITLIQGQKELAAIKKNAKKHGKITRSQMWSQS